MTRRNRWHSLGLKTPDRDDAPGGHEVKDLLAFALMPSGDLNVARDPIHLMIEAIGDELTTLASALSDGASRHASTARNLARRAYVARMLLEEADVSARIRWIDLPVGSRSVPADDEDDDPITQRRGGS